MTTQAQEATLSLESDTVRDIECAKANGCVAFAVGTGPNTAEELQTLGADHAVKDLADPSPLLTLLG